MNTGKIIAIDRKLGVVQIEELVTDCSTCPSKDGCKGFASGSKYIIAARYRPDLKLGDVVGINILPSNRIASSVILFLVPTLFLIAGFLVGQKIFHNETVGGVLGFVSLVVCFLFLFLLNKKGFFNSITAEIVTIEKQNPDV